MNRAQLTNWYNTLSPRDRIVLHAAGLVALVLLLAAVLLPLQLNLGKARARLQAQQADLEWMRRVGPTLAAAGPGPVGTPAESLAVVIDSTARESGLAQALNSQPGANGGMRVQVDHADFNLLAGWIARLSAQHGVRVESAILTSSSPGVVNASLQMRAR